MENLFIKNSSQSQEKLIESKKFLDVIVGQIRSAYSNIKHFDTRNHKDSTTICIGIHNNRACTHRFNVNNEGIITYTSHDLLFFDVKGEQHPFVTKMLEKYPKSNFYSHKFELVVEIESEEDFLNKVKDIVFMLERDGFVLKR